MFDLSKAAFSKAAVSNLDTARKIPIDEIAANNDNFYSITGIEELAESIKMVGLLSPVNVVKTDAGYKLISGHRRLAAFKLLRGGDDADASSYDRIPAMVVSGLDDLTETMALITANSTARELTYADKCKQEDMLRKTLLAMRDAGRDIPKNLGQYIADQIGVSRNEVSRMHSVNTNLAPEHKAQLEAGELTAQQAYELSRQGRKAPGKRSAPAASAAGGCAWQTGAPQDDGAYACAVHWPDGHTMLRVAHVRDGRWYMSESGATPMAATLHVRCWIKLPDIEEDD